MSPPFSLFEVFGIEIEYMIVDRTTLKIQPIADQLLQTMLGFPGNEFIHNEISWSNELALHVLELKVSKPCADLQALPALFQREVEFINAQLKTHQACLLPTGMHPFMNPETETYLWPHSQQEIYAAYHRIFNCHNHGWVNAQSTHLNLPFANDAEFHRLHTAIRLILPLLPALSASSPFVEGQASGYQDNRLVAYGANQSKYPLISGMIIPEYITSEQEYREKILQPMYQAIAKEDPDGLLQHPWLNSRGAIPNFERKSIEIRILDTQEIPMMDLAIVVMIVNLLKALCNERWSTLQQQAGWSEVTLYNLYQQTIRFGGETQIQDADYLRLFGIEAATMSVKAVWHILIKELCSNAHWARPYLNLIITQGNLAERILAHYADAPTVATMTEIYHDLADCLAQNQPFKT